MALEADDQERDIWILDIARLTLMRLTSDPRNDQKPVWTSDSRRIVFASDRAGVSNLYWQAADGTGPTERLTTSAHVQLPESFSLDGKKLLLREAASETGRDLLVLPLDGDRKATPLIATKFNEFAAQLSPDGRWLAYASEETGQLEVYVRPFPDVNDGRWTISTSSGNRPMWSRDGRELFYMTTRGPASLMAVAIKPSQSFGAGSPQKILDWHYAPNYDVSPEGKRFLAIKLPTPTTSGTSESSPFVVVENWFDELKRLAPTK